MLRWLADLRRAIIRGVTIAFGLDRLAARRCRREARANISLGESLAASGLDTAAQRLYGLAAEQVIRAGRLRDRTR